MLIEISKEEGLQNKISEELFEAFFIHGKNIGEFNELNNIARQNNIKNFSKDIITIRKDLTKKVQESDNISRSKGIGGVPFFIINDHYAISGAQESEVFKKIFETCLLESNV